MLPVSAKPPANGQSEKVYREFSGLTTRQYYSMPNIAVMYGVGDAIELQSLSSVSTRQVSVGPIERDVTSDDLNGPSRKSCSLMPNIHVKFSTTEATGFQCITVQASAEVKNGLTIPADVLTSLDSIASSEGGIVFTVPMTLRECRTWWKRTKKFVRRLFCACVTYRNIAHSIVIENSLLFSTNKYVFVILFNWFLYFI
jgi:hypothetical protein